MNKKIIIGNIIRYMRKKNGYTQEELANKVNIGRSTLSDYEREKTDISYDTMRMICNECGYEIEFKNLKTNETITANNIDRLV